MNVKILNKEAASAITNLSISTIMRLEKAGQFPKRIKISAKRVGWLESDIANWLKSKVEPATSPTTGHNLPAGNPSLR